MIIKTAFKIGGVNYELHVEEKDEMDALHKAIVLSNPRTYCVACGSKTSSEDTIMTTNKDKEGNTYVNIKHVKSGCGAASKLGLYKSGGFFWHGFEKYVPKEQKAEVKSSDPF